MLRKLNGDLMEKMHFVGVFCVNDNKEIDHSNLQMMCYIFCYDNLVNAYNSKIQVRKFISYYKINDIIIFNKHVNAIQIVIAKHLRRRSLVH
jgi:hypothetical protein